MSLCLFVCLFVCFAMPQLSASSVKNFSFVVGGTLWMNFYTGSGHELRPRRGFKQDLMLLVCNEIKSLRSPDGDPLRRKGHLKLCNSPAGVARVTWLPTDETSSVASRSVAVTYCFDCKVLSLLYFPYFQLNNMWHNMKYHTWLWYRKRFSFDISRPICTVGYLQLY